MNASHSILPNAIAYQPSYEIAEEDEAETRAALLESLHKISAITYKDSGHATRSVHAKSHGLLRVEFDVPNNLPPLLAQGIFSQPGVRPAVMRLSTIPGDILDDSISTPRGMAIKIIGVEGERLSGSEGDCTQDFVLVNGPVFSVPDAKHFVGGLKLLAATTDKAPGLKKAVATVFRGIEKTLESVGKESTLLKTMGAHPHTHILGETFYSQVPLLYGPHMAKISVAPVSAELLALVNTHIDLKENPDGLREAVVAFFAENTAEWEIRVQLCTNLGSMPIEDASIQWPESESPYITVGRIIAAPQLGWSDALSKAVDDGMSFNPWHCISAHRPLGSIMRARKFAYEMSRQFRAEHNRTSITEPTHLDNFPVELFG